MIDNSDKRYLFHGTGMYCLASILDENRLCEGAHWGKPGEPHGPRLTESFAIASGFVTYNAYFAEGGVLVIDRQKLALDYPLLEYQDTFDGKPGDDEQEVVAITPVIEDISKYLVALVFDPDYLDELETMDFMETAWSEGGWPDRIPSDEDGAAIMKRWLDALRSHPLINAVGDESDIPRHGNIETRAAANSP